MRNAKFESFLYALFSIIVGANFRKVIEIFFLVMLYSYETHTPRNKVGYFTKSLHRKISKKEK